MAEKNWLPWPVLASSLVRAGEENGEAIYVGRALHENDLLPSKVIMSKGGAFFSWGGNELSTFKFEVLVDTNAAWKHTSANNIPDNAIPAGKTRDGETLYMGRVLIEGTITPGKVHPSHGVVYIPFGGKEHKFSEYEILIRV